MSLTFFRTKNSPPEKNSNKDFVLEHVPLCFDDELERQNVKVLTARPPTDYTLPVNTLFLPTHMWMNL